MQFPKRVPAVREVRGVIDRLLGEASRYAKHAWHYAQHNRSAVLTWGVGGLFFLGGATVLWAATLQLPDLGALQNSSRFEQSVKIYDRTGSVLLFDLHKNMQRTMVPLGEISPELKNAIIAIEDPDFYSHKGIKPTAILRAIFTNLTQGDLLSGQGGSTITQQVIKLTVLTTDKTVTRKLKEWVLALKMERVLNKNQILELYLNQVPFGGQLYGVEEAAMTFFGKHASDLTVPESAYLAAMLPAPTRLSPYGNNLDQLEVRKNLVLSKMLEHGYLTDEEFADAKSATVAFVPPRDSSIAAPHFVFYVRQYLEDKYGTEALEQGGWKVTTTLDADLQAKAEEVVQRNALANVDRFKATNMAMTALDPKTGQILVMVGSRNYFDDEIQGAYNVVTMKPGRQPGSSFKPFVYAEAFAEGYTPNTVLFDVRTQFSTTCSASNMTTGSGCYAPIDYDNKYPGPLTLRNALAQSRNIPAVKLLYLVGLNNALRMAKTLGITTLSNPAQYGLTMVLGGGEVTPLEMTSAYATFANNGMRYETTPVLKVEDADGVVLEDNTLRQGNQVIAPEIAEKVNDVLSDVEAARPLGLSNFRQFGQDVALKTGTTNDYHDAWILAYTPTIAMGLWAGNNDNRPMEVRTGGAIVAPAMRDFMQYALTKVPSESFSRAEYTPANKAVLNGNWTVPGSDGRPHEILYWVNKNDPTGPPPSNPANDSQYSHWEYSVQRWIAANGVPAPQPPPSDPGASTTPPGTGLQPFPGSIVPLAI